MFILRVMEERHHRGCEEAVVPNLEARGRHDYTILKSVTSQPFW